MQGRRAKESPSNRVHDTLGSISVGQVVLPAMPGGLSASSHDRSTFRLRGTTTGPTFLKAADSVLHPVQSAHPNRLATERNACIIGLMPDEPLPDMLQLAVELAQDAARIALAQVGRAKATRKPDQSMVTETDRAIERHILGAIRTAYPSHAICAEESANRPDTARSDTRYCWVIDPLDGTRNFVAGLPCFATSIAVLDAGRPVIAVVLEHNVGDLYTALRGEGTRRNGHPVTVAEIEPNSDALVGIPSSKDPLTVGVVKSWAGTKGLVMRNTGSTALHLAMVGAGMLAAAFSKRCKIWDVAAGALLVTEAGGCFTDPWGAARIPFDLGGDPEADLPFLAAAPGPHQQLTELLRSAAEHSGA